MMLPITLSKEGIPSKDTLSLRLNPRKCRKISTEEKYSIWLLILIIKRFKALRTRSRSSRGMVDSSTLVARLAT